MAHRFLVRALSSSSVAAGDGSPFSSLLRRCFSDLATEFCSLLRRPPNPSGPKLEISLNRAAAGRLDPSAAETVLRRSPTSTAAERSTLLRFFVWAGLQPGCRHSAAIYCTASKSLQISHHPETINHLLDAYKRDGVMVSVRTFKVVLNMCQHGGAADQALQVLTRMPEFGCRPDTSSYNAVLRLLAGAAGEKEIDQAKGLLKEMSAAGVFPDLVTCVAMVKALCSSGRFSEAKTFVESMRSRGCVPNVVVYSALLDGACNSGDLPAATEILEEMETGSAGELCRPNVVTYTCLIKCLSEKGMMEEALAVFDRMGKHGCAANRVTVATLLQGLCRRKLVAEAFSLVERVAGDGAVAGADAYSSLILCLVRAGNAEAAEELTEKMMQTGLNPDGAARNVLLGEIISSGRRGVDRGISWVEQMWAAGLTVDPEVYSSLIDFSVREGKLTEAAGVIEGMFQRGVPLKVNSSSSAEAVAKTLEKAGRVDLAQRLLTPHKST